MENTNKILSAYYEAGKVVVAYLCGYICEEMELNNRSKFIPGSDGPMVQAILTGKGNGIPDTEKQHSIGVAQKLMTVASAGVCAMAFYKNGGHPPAELDIEIPGNDLMQIEVAQAHLLQLVGGHSAEYPSEVIASVCSKLSSPEVWRATDMLAQRAIAGQPLTRFYIEDTLMVAGIKLKATTSTIGQVGVKEHESTTEKPASRQQSTFEHISPLDVMLKDFLTRIKSDWQPGELDAAVTYLNEVYRKYGK